jgi:hypothetical protein
MGNFMPDKKILTKCIDAYVLVGEHFVKSLRKQRYYEAAKYIETMLGNTDTPEDVYALDQDIRKLFEYKTNAVAPWGFYPMLGLALSISNMNVWTRDMPDWYRKNHLSFLGAFADFHCNVQKFCDEIENTIGNGYDLKYSILAIYE